MPEGEEGEQWRCAQGDDGARGSAAGQACYAPAQGAVAPSPALHWSALSNAGRAPASRAGETVTRFA